MFSDTAGSRSAGRSVVPILRRPLPARGRRRVHPRRTSPSDHALAREPGLLAPARRGVDRGARRPAAAAGALAADARARRRADSRHAPPGRGGGRALDRGARLPPIARQRRARLRIAREPPLVAPRLGLAGQRRERARRGLRRKGALRAARPDAGPGRGRVPPRVRPRARRSASVVRRARRRSAGPAGRRADPGRRDAVTDRGA